MAKKLSKRIVDAELKKGPEQKGQRFVFDSVIPGLALRIRGASATWVFAYRYHGKSQRVKLEDAGAMIVEGARERARDLRSQVADGDNPADVKR